MGTSSSKLSIEVEIPRSVDATSDVHLTRRIPRSQKSWIDVFQSDPALAFRKDYATGRLPLHIAIDVKAPEALIRIIISLNPSAVAAVDEKGLTPICHGLVNKCPTSILELLLDSERSSESLLIADQQGLLPLHHAIINQCATEFIMKVFHNAPQAAHVATRMSKYALHYAAEHQVDVKVINALIKEFPAALEETFDTRLPLHYAVQYRASFEVVDSIYKAYKTAALCKSINGMFPIHLAVQHRAPAKVIQLLIRANIDALIVRDRCARMPLHYALERKAPEALVLNILKACPATASYKGHGSPGDLPLVMALEKHYSHEIIKEICISYPEGVKVPNSFNMLPLRCALKANATNETIEMLIKYYPDAASEVDEHGRVALHYAISRDMPLALVQSLIIGYPTSVQIQDKNGQLPIHIACVRKCSLDLLQELIKSYEDGLIIRDRYDYVPINHLIENNASLSYFKTILIRNTQCLTNRCLKGRLPLHQAIEFKRSTEIIKILIEGYPEATADHELKQLRIPLQWAIERLLPLSTLKCIYDANPINCSKVCDAKGWYSIHYAIHYPTPVEIVQLLLKVNYSIAQITAFPLHMKLKEKITLETIHHDNDNKEEEQQQQQQQQKKKEELLAVKDAFMLLHYAIYYHALPTTVAEILLYTLPITTTGELYDNHCDTWAYILSKCQDAYDESVDIVLKHYEHDQSLIQQLANFPDRYTNPAIQVAKPKSLYQIIRRLHLFSRYETYKGLSIHQSKYNLIHSAIDHDVGFIEKSSHDVILKFTNHRKRFLREIKIRQEVAFDNKFVLELKRSHDSFVDKIFQEEIQLKGYEAYPFLMVFSRAERDLLNIAKHEHFVGFNMNLARHYGRQLLHALQHIHHNDVVHGDLKPSNIVRENNALKIMNFGAASRLSLHEMVSTDLEALGYVAPEVAATYLIRINDENQEMVEKHYDYINPVPRSNSIDGMQQEDQNHHLSYDDTQRDQPNDLYTDIESNTQRIVASISQDMWSFGAIMYLLCTGESLFLTTLDEHIDDDQLHLLCDWPDFAKERRLAKISDPTARAIVGQLLDKSARMRPNTEYCLQHPFFADTTPLVRFPGAMPDFDVIIVHRSSPFRNPLRYYDGLPMERPAPDDNDLHGANAFQHHSLSTIQSNTTVETELDSEQRKARDAAMRRMFGSQVEDSISTTDSQTIDPSVSNEKGNEIIPRNSDESLRGKHRKQCQQRVLRSEVVDDDFHCQLLCEEFNYLSLKVGVPKTYNTVPMKESGDYDVDINLTKAAAAVIILSKFSFQTNENCKIDRLTENSPFDSFYYELRLALELSERNFLEKGVYLLAIGDVLRPNSTAGSEGNREGSKDDANRSNSSKSVCYDSYFESYMGDMVGRYGGSHAYSIVDVVVNSIELRVEQFLHEHGLGIPLYPKGLSVKEAMQKLIQLPTFYIIGEQTTAFGQSATKIAELIHGTGTIVLPSTPYSRPSTGAFAMLDRSRVVTPVLRSSRSSINSPSIAAAAASAVMAVNGEPIRSLRSSWVAGNGVASRKGSMGIDRTQQPLISQGSDVEFVAVSEEARYYQSKQPHHHDYSSEAKYTYYPYRRSSRDGSRESTMETSPSARHSPYQYVGSSPMVSPQQVSRTTSRGRSSRPGSMQGVRFSGTLSRADEADPNRSSLPDIINNNTIPNGFVNWSRPETMGGSFNLGMHDDFYDEPQTDKIVFFNDEVKLPHLTEVVGVERAKTADTLRFLAGKLEASENEVTNLHDELSLLRERMNKKDDEISRLRRSLNITMKDGSLPPV